MSDGIVLNQAALGGRKTHQKRPHHPSPKGGPVTFEHLGFRVQILGQLGCYVGVIQKEDGSLLPITHFNGDYFFHRGTARTTAKSVIEWHLKFGGWNVPKYQERLLREKKKTERQSRRYVNPAAVRSQSTAPPKG